MEKNGERMRRGTRRLRGKQPIRKNTERKRAAEKEKQEDSTSLQLAEYVYVCSFGCLLISDSICSL